MNYMNEICKMFNLNMYQPFKIKFKGHNHAWKHAYYCLTEDGLCYFTDLNNPKYTKSDGLSGLIVGKHEIITIG